MSRKNKKKAKNFDANFKLKCITPETLGQEGLFDLYKEIPHFILSGYAGTGKTFCATYLALSEILDKDTPFEKLVIVRNCQQSGIDMGALPGNSDEKMENFELPYKTIFNELFGRADAYEVFKKRRTVEFMPTNFSRGITIDNSIVIIDEAQNLQFSELDTFATRVGINTRLLICGDERQTDLDGRKYKSGFGKFTHITKFLPVDTMKHIEFDIEDIIRSGFVKDYIIAKENLD